MSAFAVCSVVVMWLIVALLRLCWGGVGCVWFRVAIL